MNFVLLELVIWLSIFCYLFRKEAKLERRRADDALNQLRAEREDDDFSELETTLSLNNISIPSDYEQDEGEF